MKVRTLLDLLEGVNEDHDVMIAQQPGWPLASRLIGVVPASDMVRDDDDPTDDPRTRTDIVWLAAGDATGYAPGEVFVYA